MILLNTLASGFHVVIYTIVQQWIEFIFTIAIKQFICFYLFFTILFKYIRLQEFFSK